MIKLQNQTAFILFIAAFISACKTKSLTQNINDHASKATINFQVRKAYGFNKDQVLFTNNFGGARLNSISQANDSTFNIEIAPENEPINPSPWYAFKVWSAPRKNLYINLNYKGTSHRYNPKYRYRNQPWIDIADLKISQNKKQASFKISANSDTLLIAAQELLSASDNYHWEDSLVRLPQVKRQKIGESILGKPINAITIGNKSKKLIVVLSRQHPPEVTGYMAMQEFIRTVTANTELAKNFRMKFELILIPVINPDGVDEGNWRHSVAGVDLNRDWENFAQPETRAVKDYILKKIMQQNAKVYFGIDFHSTYYDVFYTNEDQPLNKTNLPGFTQKWLHAFSENIPGFKPNIKPSPNGGNVSKSWMGRVLRAEALTYEVGDDTPRALLKLKGKVAAEKMMELLLAAEDK